MPLGRWCFLACVNSHHSYYIFLTTWYKFIGAGTVLNFFLCLRKVKIIFLWLKFHQNLSSKKICLNYCQEMLKLFLILSQMLSLNKEKPSLLELKLDGRPMVTSIKVVFNAACSKRECIGIRNILGTFSRIPQGRYYLSSSYTFSCNLNFLKCENIYPCSFSLLSFQKICRIMLSKSMWNQSFFSDCCPSVMSHKPLCIDLIFFYDWIPLNDHS